jgi:rhomboid protease GluP
MGTPPIPEPEILRPDGYEPSQAEFLEPQFAPPVRKQRSSWSVAPATYILIAVNCLVFVAMVAHHVSPLSPVTGQLMYYGADNAGAVLLQDQWWRILTAMFVHVGFIHLATNMWCLWNLGLLAEPLLGSFGLITVYVLTGAAGNLLSTLVNWWSYNSDWVQYHAAWITQHAPGELLDPTLVFPAAAGASGAVFGIAGALIVLLKSQRLPVPPDELKKLRKSVIYFAAINLAIGFTISFGSRVIHSGLQIDNMAHLGGCLCGLLFAVPLVPRFGSPRPLFQSKLKIAIGMMIGVLVLFGFFVAQQPR